MFFKTVLCIPILSILIVGLHQTSSSIFGPVPDEVKKQYEQELGPQGPVERLISGTMNYMYQNKTLASVIAGELWNFGTKAVNFIVSIKDPTRSASDPYAILRGKYQT
ncbi:hypothetical protein JYU34_009748 [Plutella xylostella]|uniref:Uncharacterized protein n=2 Tax=Plutella xylostella TaxID=51655 RepID=A0ABQ7QMY9_PLUXY|nr:uncharacterized protein LOC105390617 [Plutella xylostella]KAG7305648.1 hypothetical protein JYU34_009748 [Plutella xylostella]CAG9091551.1 unnamed protein product [Plutella xylostella]